MNYLQDTIQAKNENNSSRPTTIFHFINLILILSNFALNFIGRPELKYLYLVHVIIIILSVIIFPIHKILPEIITLFFLEGQGRIIWQYQSWARIIFDITLLLAVIKVFITTKKIYKKEIIPTAFIWLIACHFLWYFVQIFNVNAASVIGVIAATKIYIFPILLFLGLSQSNLDTKKADFNYTLGFFALIFFLELALNLFQMQDKQLLLLKISPYYLKATKNGIFTGHLFRPFATTHLPGALSNFIWLTPALLYLKPLNLWQSLFRYFIIGISIVNLIVCQVRSALIKYILILILLHIGDLIYHRLNYKKLLPYIVVLGFVTFNLNNFLSKIPALDDANLQYAIARATSLEDVNKLKSSRISTDTLGSVISDQLSKYPFGVGPGMTGAASSVNTEEIAKDPIFRGGALWTHDNLFISLAMDLGYGAIFYLILIGLIPVHFTQELLKLYRKKDDTKFRTILVCVSTLCVVLIGNWGAVGITYNPESFVYWFFAALGFHTLADQREKYKGSIKNGNLSDKL